MNVLVRILSLVVILLFSSCTGCTEEEEDDEASWSDSTSMPADEAPPVIVPRLTEEERIDSILHVEVEHDTATMYELPSFTIQQPSVIDFHLAYTVSFNSETRNANWVAWCLTRLHTHGPDGDPFSRKKLNPPYYRDFDTTSVRQELYDWHGAYPPYEHGHLCPAADNKWDEAAMRQSFFLSNMTPQHSDFNSGDWVTLEKKCRHWANIYGEIYIATGPIFYNKNYKTLPEGKIAIPDAFFKVVMRLNPEPKAIGFIFTNNSNSQSLLTAAKTIDEIERITGFDFFYLIDDETENEMERTYNPNDWADLI